eukprot:tig00020710_g13361.t1
MPGQIFPIKQILAYAETPRNNSSDHVSKTESSTYALITATSASTCKNETVYYRNSTFSNSLVCEDNTAGSVRVDFKYGSDLSTFASVTLQVVIGALSTPKAGVRIPVGETATFYMVPYGNSDPGSLDLSSYTNPLMGVMDNAGIVWPAEAYANLSVLGSLETRNPPSDYTLYPGIPVKCTSFEMKGTVVMGAEVVQHVQLMYSYKGDLDSAVPGSNELVIDVRYRVGGKQIPSSPKRITLQPFAVNCSGKIGDRCRVARGSLSLIELTRDPFLPPIELTTRIAFLSNVTITRPELVELLHVSRESSAGKITARLVGRNTTSHTEPTRLYITASSDLSDPEVKPLSGIYLANQVIEVVAAATIACSPLRVVVGTNITCNVTAALPALQASDLTPSVSPPTAGSLSELIAVSGQPHQFEFTFVPSEPVLGSIDVGGSSVPFTSLNATLTCDTLRGRVGAAILCNVTKFATGGDLFPSDFVIRASPAGVAGDIGPHPTLSGSLSFNFTLTNLTGPSGEGLQVIVSLRLCAPIQRASLDTALMLASLQIQWHPSLTGGLSLVTVVDGLLGTIVTINTSVHCPPRVGVAANFSCILVPPAGSAPLLPSDFADVARLPPSDPDTAGTGSPAGTSMSEVFVALSGDVDVGVSSLQLHEAGEWWLRPQWSMAVGGGFVRPAPVVVVGAILSCPPRVREGADIVCVLVPSPGGPALDTADFLPGTVVPADAARVLPLVLLVQQPGNVSLGLLNVSLHLGGVNVSVRYNSSINSASPEVSHAQSPSAIFVVAAVLSTNATRAAAGAPAYISVTLARKSGSEPLLATDFEGFWLLKASADGGSPQISDLVPTAASGDSFTFLFDPPAAGAALRLWANYSSSMGGGLVTEVSVAVVEATIACAPLRVVVGTNITCNVSRTAASPALVASDLTLSVSPPAAGTISELVAVSGQPHQFEFTFVPSEPVLGSIDVRYSQLIDPSTRLVGGSSVPFTSLNATLTCDTLRGRVGAAILCNVTKFATGGDLFPSDFVIRASPAGVAGDIGPHPTLSGSLSFNFTLTNLTGPSGEGLQVIVSLRLCAPIQRASLDTALMLASLQIQWHPSLTGGLSLVTVVDGLLGTIVTINASVHCPPRVGVAANFSCILVPPAGSAPLLPSDFADVARLPPSDPDTAGTGSPAGTSMSEEFVALSGDVDVGVSSLQLHEAGEWWLRPQWSMAVGGGFVRPAPVVVVGAMLSCPPRVREGADIVCVLVPSPGGPALDTADFLPGTVVPADAARVLPLVLLVQQPGNVSLGLLNVSLHLGGVNVSVRYNSSINSASPEVSHAQSPSAIFVVAAVLSANATRAAAGAPAYISVTLARKSGSEPLLATDFEGFWLLKASADGGSPQISDLVPTAASGDSFTFLFEPPAAGAALRLWANYSSSMGGGLVTEVSVAVVEATIACAPLRVVVGTNITCNVSRTAASPALVASDLTLSVSPPAAGTISELVAVSGQPHQFEFTFVPSEPVLGSIDVRYSQLIDPSTRLVGGSSVPFTSLNATLTCDTLRGRVGAAILCNVTKFATGGNLFPSDFVIRASPAGVAGDIGPHPTLSGSLSFNFTLTNLTGPSGEGLQIQWHPSLTGGLSLVTVVDGLLGTIVTINAPVHCPLRVGVAANFSCILVPPAGSAPLLPSDFADVARLPPSDPDTAGTGSPAGTSMSEVFVALSGDVDVGVSSLQLHEAGEWWLRPQWSMAVGGGFVRPAPVVVVGAMLSCPPRVREGADIVCVLVPSPGGPALDTADFLPGTVVPADAARVLPLVLLVQQPGNVSLGLLNVSLHLGGVNVSVRYNSSINSASPEVSHAQSPSAIFVVAAVLSANATRAAAGAPAYISVTLARKSGSEPLLATDFEGFWLLKASADGGSPQISDLVPTAASGDSFTFLFEPPAAGAALRLWANYSSSMGGGLVTEVSVAVVEATIACAPLRVVVGTNITCNVSRTAASPALVASDLTLSVSPPAAGTISELVAVSGQPHQFEFTFVPSEPVLGSIDVRYSQLIDPSTRLVGGSSVPFTSLNATLTCDTLRGRVGAAILCNVTKFATGGDLFPSDFVIRASPAGVAGDIGPHPTLSGSLSFNFTLTNLTGPSGEGLQVIVSLRLCAPIQRASLDTALMLASLQIQWHPSLTGGLSLVTVVDGLLGTIVTINASVHCPLRVGVAANFSCILVPPAGSAPLLPSDFADVARLPPSDPDTGGTGSPAGTSMSEEFVALSGDVDVGVSSLQLHEAGEWWLRPQWSMAVGGGFVRPAPVVVVGAILSCPPRVREGADIVCVLVPSPGGPALDTADFLPGTVAPADAARVLPLVLLVQQPGNVSLGLLNVSLHLGGVNVSVRYNSSINSASPEVSHAQSPSAILVVAAVLSANATRAAAGAPAYISVTLARKSGSEPLLATDFEGFWLLKASADGGSPQISDLVPTAASGDSFTFLFDPPAAGAALRLWANYSSSMGGGLVTEVSVAVVEATIACAPLRVVVGTNITCNVSRTAASPALVASDLTLSVSPPAAGTISELVAVSGQPHQFEFTFVPSEPVLGSIDVRYSQLIDPSTRLVGGSSVPFTSLNATLTCDTLRGRVHVGAAILCNVTKFATGGDLFPSDFVIRASPAGVAGDIGPHPTLNGSLSFNFTFNATAPTGPGGEALQVYIIVSPQCALRHASLDTDLMLASLQIQWHPSLTGGLSLVTVVDGLFSTLVVISASLHCPPRVGVAANFSCILTLEAQEALLA